jgi:molybdopterin molybdotransferase
MPEFLQLTPIRKAIDLLLANLPAKTRLSIERIPTVQSSGRVLAEDILAPHPLPEFARSTVDGYAVQAADTHGASASLPAYLNMSGEILMGQPAEQILVDTHAILIHTGAMLPPGADAVVMLEDTQQVKTEEIEILRPVAVGENVIQVAEDVKEGDLVMQSGKRLRAQEIGGLLALGFTQVSVYKRPLVGIISTGDEVVPPDEIPELAQVRDINSYTLQHIINHHGGEAILRGIAGDSLETLQTLVDISHSEDDLIIVTAGSSVSARDLTAQAFEGLGNPGILVHGIAIKPGKPTILAVADDIPAVGLPGNPVSALIVGSLILPAILDRLYGMPGEVQFTFLEAKLTSNVASQAGRDDYHPVRVWEDDNGLHAEPIYGRSNLIFTLVRANGLLVIPSDSNGFEAGARVRVIPF